MNSRRDRSNTESFCQLRHESASDNISYSTPRKSRSRSHGDLNDDRRSPSNLPSIMHTKIPNETLNLRSSGTSSSGEHTLMYGKKVIPGEGIYEGYLTFDGIRSGKGSMKGFDAPASASFKSIAKGGAKKNLKYQYEGSWEKDHPHGFGVYKYFQSGDRYEGNFVDGKRHGLGIFLWGNGDKYTGNFEHGMMSGLGRFEWAHGDVYHGMWKAGKVMGDGYMSGSDGSQSQGSFRDGLLHGWAKKIWPQGDMYSGYFLEDTMSNYGSYQWIDGHRYEGEWKENKSHGIGQYVTAAKSLPNTVEYTTCRGEYKCGLQCGIGCIEIEDSGSSYIGEVVELMESAYDKKEEARNAWGQISYENGVSYEGDCIDCVRDGYGILIYNKISESNEDLLYSECISNDDIKRLAGTLDEQYLMLVAQAPLDFDNLPPEREVEDILLEMGGIYRGHFKDDVPHGKGVFELCNGQFCKVEYRMGILAKP